MVVAEGNGVFDVCIHGDDNVLTNSAVESMLEGHRDCGSAHAGSGCGHAAFDI